MLQQQQQQQQKQPSTPDTDAPQPPKSKPRRPITPPPQHMLQQQQQQQQQQQPITPNTSHNATHRQLDFDKRHSTQYTEAERQAYRSSTWGEHVVNRFEAPRRERNATSSRDEDRGDRSGPPTIREANGLNT